MRFVLCAIAWVVLAPAALAETLMYRCTDASGRVTFSDKPVGQNCLLQRLETPPPGAPRGSGLTASEKSLAEQADKRAAALDRAMADIVTAFNALREAEARKEQGIEPREGERQGRRYRPEYWQRQQEVQRDVDQARARLNDALERRNALR